MTDIVAVPAAPVVPPFPALGAPNFNQEAYDFGAAMPGVADGVHAIGVAAHTNATAAQELASALSGSAAAAVGSALSADESATSAATSASNAATSELNAEASAVQASKLNLGHKSAPPALDNQGAPLLAGATYYDTTLEKWRVWTGSAWGDGVSAVAGVASINGQTGDVVLPPGIINIAYDDRAQLRSNSTGTHALVDGLGLFQYATGSDEPDDDESCFATATGRWLLECPHWDVVADWQIPDNELRDAVGSILRARVACPISSVAAVAQASFTGFALGAAPGDAVLAAPLTAVGTNIAVTAMVAAADTIVVTLNNASAATASGIPADWAITVFKEI